MVQTARQQSYPWTTDAHGAPVTLRLLQPSDQETLLEFARSLPADDLLFLSVDITQPEAVAHWVRENAAGRLYTILVESEGKLLGHGSLLHNNLQWTRHLGEIMLLLAPEARGRRLGYLLARELLTLARELGLRKMVARVATEQHGARQVLEKNGFRAEALLADFVIDRLDRTHDLVVMTYDVTGFTDE